MRPARLSSRSTAVLRTIHRLDEAQVRHLHVLYQEEWWTAGRRLADVRRMLVHSSLVVAFCEARGDRLVAFARVLTDRVYKALILDVIVSAGLRGRGFGRRLLKAVLARPELADVRHFELYCRPERAAFYRHFGFEGEAGDLVLMRMRREEAST